MRPTICQTVIICRILVNYLQYIAYEVITSVRSRETLTYLRIVSTHVLQYLCPHAIVCTASLRSPSHLGHNFFLSITDRSAGDKLYPGMI